MRKIGTIMKTIQTPSTPLTPEQVHRYLEVLGIDPEGDLTPTIELLDAITEAHQLNISFEDIDSAVLKKGILPLDPQSLFEKVIVNRRGGFCYELNALFHALLVSMGFKAHPVMARIVMRTYDVPVNHRGEIVYFDSQRRYTDVGFGGPSAAYSLAIEDGFTRESYGKTFTVTQLQEPGWWIISYVTDNGLKDVIEFQEIPASELDFAPLSLYSASHPDSPFSSVLIANRRTRTGSLALRETTLTVVEDGVHTVTELDKGDVANVLREKFDIHVESGIL